MIDSFEHKGKWRTPTSPDVELAGTLRFSLGRGLVLDLVGLFEGETDANKGFQSDIVLGISDKEITLVDCFMTNKTRTGKGVTTSSICANLALMGAHFYTKEEIKFEEISIQYLHLDQWANVSGFSNEAPAEPCGITIKYSQPEPIEAFSNGSFRVFIDFLPTYTFGRHERAVKQRTTFRIQFSEQRHYREFVPIIYGVQNFLTLAVGEPTYPLKIKGVFTSDGAIQGEERMHSVDLIRPLANFPHEIDTRLRREMLFNLSDVRTNLCSVLAKWLSASESLRPVHSLYFGTLNNPRLYWENRFLSLVQAVESYHRRTRPNEASPPEVHDDRLKRIISGAPDECKKWLAEQLRYSNEPRLRRRLKDLVKEFSAITDLFIQNRGTFISKVVDTRNFLTHYDESLVRKSAKEIELYEVTENLKALLEICFLSDLGFSTEEIKSRMSRRLMH